MKIHTIEVFMLVVDGVLYNESRSTLAAQLALAVVGRAFSRRLPSAIARRRVAAVLTEVVPRFASLGQAVGRG